MSDYPLGIRQKITSCIFYGRTKESLDAFAIKKEYNRCKLLHLGKKVSFK